MQDLDRLSPGSAPKPQTVADQICAVLRQAIVDGSLRGGAVLRQDDLALKFGFSRMPIRDALRHLETEGLVTIHPTKGAFVALMDKNEITEIYAVRELLELEALRLSCKRLGIEQLQNAKRALDQIDTETDPIRWSALNTVFHMSLYGQCQNDRLLSLIRVQHNAADRYVSTLLSHLQYQGRSQEEHRELLAACEKADVRKATGILREHLQQGRKTLVTAVSNLSAE